MKKSKLSICLVSSFMAAMTLAGCSDVKAKDNALVTFKPYGSGEEVTIVTDDMYNEFRDTTTGITKYYEQILEVLIRYDFKKGGEASKKESYGNIEKIATKEVETQKQKAKDNAKANDTSYETEWEAILDSNGVEDAKELKELFIYNHEKETMQDWYYEANEETLKKEYLGITDTGEAVTAQEGYGQLTSKLPYHIRHILVKNEDGASNYNTGSISESATNNLVKVINKLVAGEMTFGWVAKENSEDSSGEKFGDVGIMTNNASADGSLGMGAEFQLGSYAYDALVSNKSNTAINAGLGIDTDVQNTVKSVDFASSADNTINGLTEVPFNVFADLEEYADVTTDVAGHKVLDSEQESVVYPRNILWNKYLNHHNPFIITNRNRTTIDNITSVETGAADKLESGYDASVAEKAPGTCGFKSAYALGLIGADNGMKVLTDEQDNVIIGVRSQYGIHLSVIQKSMFDFTAPSDDASSKKVSLEEYYTTVKTTDEKYPKYSDGSLKNTYVNYIKTSSSETIESRAEEVKNAIKSFDTTYDYRLYEYLLKTYADKISFKAYNGVKVNELIET